MKDGVTMTSLKKSTNKFIVVGYSTRLHLLLDLDKTTLPKVERLLRLIMRSYPEIGNALIVISSVHKNTTQLRYSKAGRPYTHKEANCYHLVFENKIGYNACDRILRTLRILGLFTKVADKLRGLRRCMTLRISPKVKREGVIPCPLPIAYVINPHTTRNDGMVEKYIAVLKVAYAYFADYPRYHFDFYRSQTGSLLQFQ